MHDIDRTQLEYGAELPSYEADEFEFEDEWATEGTGTLSEADEYELANELLGVASEDELDQFLGDLIKKIGKRARKLIRSPIGRAVGGVLKGVAKKALPLAGGLVGGPLGAQIGSGLASAADSEPPPGGEPAGQEEMEFEGAKQFVRLAAHAVNKAAAAHPSADPRAVAQSAAISAARTLAPGLLNQSGGGMAAAGGHAPSGRWARHGNTIVLYGV
jgi:hypothetical protein